MNIDRIIDAVCNLKNKFQTNDPFALCDGLGIDIISQPMGKSRDSCKGFCARKAGMDFITINSDLMHNYQVMVVAHELGHCVLNPNAKTLNYNDNSYFDTTDSDEKEANFFAAELLLTDNDVMDAINDELTYMNAASILGVPPEFMDFKLRIMAYKGYKLTPPMFALGNCFGDIEVRYNDNDF